MECNWWQKECHLHGSNIGQAVVVLSLSRSVSLPFSPRFASFDSCILCLSPIVCQCQEKKNSPILRVTETVLPGKCLGLLETWLKKKKNLIPGEAFAVLPRAEGSSDPKLAVRHEIRL
jgi:hypothetical protein